MSTIKVFVSYCNHLDDQEVVTQVIIPKLQENGIEIITQQDAMPGDVFLSTLTEVMNVSDKILLVITKNSIESPWCNLELLLGFEHSNTKQHLSVVLLLHDVDENEIPNKVLKYVHEASKVYFIRDSDSWVSETREKLLEYKPIHHVMPAGNVAHGLVWSHYYGFIKQVVPELEKQITESDWYKSLEDKSCFSSVLYELVPQSSKVCFNLSQIDESIKHILVFELKTIMKDGNIRKYDISIYSVDDGDKTFYFISECPSVLATISTMEDHHLAEFDEADKALQIGRFYYTMNAVINHFNNCREKARVLLFNDNKEKVPKVLLNAIKEDLPQNGQKRKEPHGASQLDTLEGTELSDYPYLAYVAHHEDNRLDAENIISHLERKGITSILKNPEVKLPGEMQYEHLKYALANCRWIIFLITSQSMKEEMLKLNVLSALQHGIHKRRVRVIPVVDRNTTVHIPDALKWITYVPFDGTDERKHCETLYNIVSGEDLPLKTELFLPAGDVANGLAWGYITNYINIVIPDNGTTVLDGINQALAEKGVTNPRCPKKLYIFIPESGITYHELKDQNNKIVNFTKTPDVFFKGPRPYSCQIYKIEDQQDMFFVGQYAAPVPCLYEMKETRVGGVTEDAMRLGTQRFCEISRNLLKSVYPEKEKFCEFVSFNDTRISLADLMVEKISRDLGDM